MIFGGTRINKGVMTKQLRHVLWFFTQAKIETIIEKEGGFMKYEEADMWIWPSSNAGLE